ncbi:MAG: RagB/SusD family nutrient uptake outer membrane protein [Bacteroidaceae bacterium]|nr:RagB/SusD family nutrient uptake outer membrane protein [Bacteroidaceae bacterium]
MKLHNIYKTIFLSGILAAGTLFTACDDFLTVLPEDFTTEEHFWESEEDLLNVRAGAYRQLASLGDAFIYWGELRADNLKLNKLDNNELLFLQQAILRPTNNNFDWSGVYKGISLCNLILAKGDEMTQEPLRDPTFSRNDYNQYSADIMGLRALYYFYLVRAFRDVPYVTSVVTSDEQAMQLYIPVSSGESILGEMCTQLEDVVNLAFTEESFTNSNDKKAYFTRTAIHALLADMYLWRGCMLKNYSAKRDAAGHHRMVNMSDVMQVSEAGDTTFVTADGTLLTDEYANEQSNVCFRAAIDHANEVIKIQMNRFYNAYQRADELARRRYETLPSNFNNTGYTGGGFYPLYRSTIAKTDRRTFDDLYTQLWSDNSNESIFEIQFDRTFTNTIYNWYATYSGSDLSVGTMVAADFLVSKFNSTVNSSSQGFGKTDLRSLETFAYTPENLSASAIPVHKNITLGIFIEEAADMSKGFAIDPTYSSTMDKNWPIYRLTDVMLIKAEALCRLGETSGFPEANYLVNHIYARNCPAMSESDTTTENTQAILLRKIYYERQREFVGEGKRWFDVVRQAEAGDYYGGRTVSLMESLSDFISVTNVVKNRTRSLWAFYCPITDSEMRVEGIQAGGYLIQNPVWERYSEIKK